MKSSSKKEIEAFLASPEGRALLEKRNAPRPAKDPAKYAENRRKLAEMLASVTAYAGEYGSEDEGEGADAEQDAALLIELLTPAYEHSIGASCLIGPNFVSVLKSYTVGGYVLRQDSESDRWVKAEALNETQH